MTERKLRQPSLGQPKPALTRLKELGAEEREAVMKILRANTYQQAQGQVAACVGFECPQGVLCRFFAWQAQREAIRDSQDMMGQVERFMQQQHPEWTEEKLRELGGMFFTMQSMGNRDAKEFVRLARLRIHDKRHQVESQKLDFYLRKFEEGNKAILESMKATELKA